MVELAWTAEDVAPVNRVPRVDLLSLQQHFMGMHFMRVHFMGMHFRKDHFVRMHFIVGAFGEDALHAWVHFICRDALKAFVDEVLTIP